MAQPAHTGVRRQVDHDHSTTLSFRLWALDWGRHLPESVDGIVVDVGSYSRDVEPFIAEHYPSIFEDPFVEQRFLAEKMTDAKRRFLREMDPFVFRDCGRVVGVVLGHPLDWSTYYWRSIAILNEYRGRGLLTSFMGQCNSVLRGESVGRLEIECSPANIPMMNVLLKLGYVVTSTSPSDRWGVLVRWTKFLNAEANGVFLRQYCVVPGQGAPPRHKEGRTP